MTPLIWFLFPTSLALFAATATNSHTSTLPHTLINCLAISLYSQVKSVSCHWSILSIPLFCLCNTNGWVSSNICSPYDLPSLKWYLSGLSALLWTALFHLFKTHTVFYCVYILLLYSSCIGNLCYSHILVIILCDAMNLLSIHISFQINFCAIGVGTISSAVEALSNSFEESILYFIEVELDNIPTTNSEWKFLFAPQLY